MVFLVNAKRTLDQEEIGQAKLKPAGKLKEKS
jgi:hypothetical protein